MTLAITAWSAISPYGYGRDAYADGVTGRTDPSAPLGPEWTVPDERACLVPDFDVRERLGGKGTRAMNRISALAVCTAGELIAGHEPDSREDTGFVLGTTVGSAQTMMDFTRASLEAEKPSHVEPAKVPGSVMNCAAGQAAIWHRLRGPNATIAAGRATGLVALNYARRLLLAGRATQVLCGAAEEYTHARSWLDHHRRPAPDRAVLGEGCAMLLLGQAQPADRPLATLVAVRSRMCLDDDPGRVVPAMVRGLLTEHGVAPDAVWAASGDRSDALREVVGDEPVDRVPDMALIGDTGSASALFQLTALLSVAATDPRAEGRFAVLTAVADDGAAACALFGLGGHHGD
jgi:3-oxoacyl-(acyl-carrier-protein) synthase